MPKLPRSPYGDLTKDDILMTLQQMSKNLDSQISFGKTKANSSYQSPDHADMNVWKASGTTPGVANTEFTVAHNLSWVPWHFTFITDNGGVIYVSRQASWTAATKSALGSVFLKCTTVSANYTLILF